MGEVFRTLCVSWGLQEFLPSFSLVGKSVQGLPAFADALQDEGIPSDWKAERISEADSETVLIFGLFWICVKPSSGCASLKAAEDAPVKSEGKSTDETGSGQVFLRISNVRFSAETVGITGGAILKERLGDCGSEHGFP